MADYFRFNDEEKIITDFSYENINSLYNEGCVFTRKSKGAMDQTRSVRVDLNKFELSSENKRVLRKTEEISMSISPLPYSNYSWEIGKLGKDFYETKFGEGTFSANKMKELLEGEHNFNLLFIFSDKKTQGYSIAKETDKIIHYSYPFYNLNYENKNIGMSMMVKAIEYAKEKGKEYIYLGSFQRPTDTYKLQFKGLEWFDGENWQTDLDKLKAQL